MFTSPFYHRISNHAKSALQLLKARQSRKLSNFLQSLHPAEAAALINSVERDLHPQLLKHIRGLDHLAILVQYASEDLRRAAIDLLDNSRISAIIRRLSIPLGAHIISILPKRRREIVLSKLSHERLNALSLNLSYDPSTAGRLANPSFIALTDNLTVEEAINFIRSHNLLRKKKTYLELQDVYYVVDTQQHLIGFVNLSDLLQNEKSVLLSIIAQPAVILAAANAHISPIARLAIDYRLTSVPVCEADTLKLLGIISIHDLALITRREQAKDMLRLCGTEERDTINADLPTAIKSRLPWLALSFCGGMLIIKLLHDYFIVSDKTLIFAIFLPLILGIMGHMTMENAAISIRGIIGGKFGSFRIKERFKKESLIGFILGSAAGVFLFVLSFLLYWDFRLSLTIGISTIVSILFSSVLGALLPAALFRLKVSPNYSSSPLLKTINDIFAVLVFCMLTRLL